MQLRAAMFALVASTAPQHPASAELAPESYAQVEATINETIGRVAKAHKLDVIGLAAVLRSTSVWFYVGPCKRSYAAQPGAEIQNVLLADPATPLGAATLEIVGVFARQGFGTPSSHACAYAGKTIGAE
jgi:hypothetical protein